MAESDSADSLRQRAKKLRFDARLAHLDGRNVRARLLNREADRLDRLARQLVMDYSNNQKGVCHVTTP